MAAPRPLSRPHPPWCLSRERLIPQDAPMTATPEVREALLAAIPSLRAFARSLTYNTDRADDLVQEAIVRGWKNLDRFEAGTNFRAWLFTILRNAFLSQLRYDRRHIADPDGAHAARFGAPPEQEAK